MRDRKCYDYSKLCGRIKEKCGTQEAFARKIKRSHTYISNVINNKAYFNQNDIDANANVLEIEEKEIGAYFFKQKVHKNETKEGT